MEGRSKLLNLKEVSKILKINTEVLRRWLRKGKIEGIKVGSDWRISEETIENYLQNGRNLSKQGCLNESQTQVKMCFKFPKWIEFSGLPSYLNEKMGDTAWPIFKKIIELDVEADGVNGSSILVDYNELAMRVGYKISEVVRMVGLLSKAGYLIIDSSNDNFIAINTPIKTPKLIFDIPFEKGGIKNAPVEALKNVCMRRFLEAPIQNT